MISADVGAIGHGAGQRSQIVAMVLRAAAVVNRASGIGDVGISAATFRDLNRGPVVIARNAHRHVVKRLRPDLPSDARFRPLQATGHVHREQPRT